MGHEKTLSPSFLSFVNKTRKFAGAAASIGQKSGSLFDQISDRYIAVNNKKRLIEYVKKLDRFNLNKTHLTLIF